VTSTLTIPAGTQIVGEAWSVIAGKGAAFQNINSPIPVVQVGAAGSTGLVEISDIIFSTIGPAPGAIVVEWNVKQSSQGAAGMWDSHIRLGGGMFQGLDRIDNIITVIYSRWDQSPVFQLPFQWQRWYYQLHGRLYGSPLNHVVDCVSGGL
jgi:hypothetical protein